MFLTSKNAEAHAWSAALARMISAVFRRGGDVRFVVDELKAVFDPRGGQWMGGRYVPSLLAAIGGAIERHMIDIGFLEIEPAASAPAPAPPGIEAARPRQCVKCGSASVVHREGCEVCTSCGWSRCG